MPESGSFGMTPANEAPFTPADDACAPAQWQLQSHSKGTIIAIAITACSMAYVCRRAIQDQGLDCDGTGDSQIVSPKLSP